MANDLLSRLDVLRTILPAQVLGELYRVLVGKMEFSRSEAEAIVMDWSKPFEVAESTWGAFRMAFGLGSSRGVPIWDALILAVAFENRCNLLLSEDFQDGFAWNGVTVANPFSPEPSPLIARALMPPDRLSRKVDPLPRRS